MRMVVREKNDEISRNLKQNLRFVEKRIGIFSLFYRSMYTGVSVERSHEGYNHFSKWYVKDNGKIKIDFGTSERELAMAAGIALWKDKLVDEILRVNERKDEKGTVRRKEGKNNVNTEHVQ
jgi:hypothetical protein